MIRYFQYLIIFLMVYSCDNQRSKKEYENKEVLSLTKKTTITELPTNLINKKDSSLMILIPYGNFIYGIDKKVRDTILKYYANADLEIFKYEFPKQKVFLRSYYIDKYEVTNSQYNKFLKETGYKKPKYWDKEPFKGSNKPVVGIGWSDAFEYAKWAGKRLPSEEEWEKAARGTDGRNWPWGNIASADYYNGNLQNFNAPISVGLYKNGVSPYGIMDMAGNVYEMTTGLWPNSKYGPLHAMRGGCYMNYAVYVRTMFRWASKEEKNGTPWLGFRCVKDTILIEAVK